MRNTDTNKIIKYKISNIIEYKLLTIVNFQCVVHCARSHVRELITI